MSPSKCLIFLTKGPGKRQHRKIENIQTSTTLLQPTSHAHTKHCIPYPHQTHRGSFTHPQSCNEIPQIPAEVVSEEAKQLGLSFLPASNEVPPIPEVSVLYGEPGILLRLRIDKASSNSLLHWCPRRPSTEPRQSSPL